MPALSQHQRETLTNLMLVALATQSFGEGDSEMESAFFSELQKRVARKILGEGECNWARCTLERVLAGSNTIQ